MGAEQLERGDDWMHEDSITETYEQHDPAARTAETDDFMYDDTEQNNYAEEEMPDELPEQTTANDEQFADVDFGYHPATEETLYDRTDEPEAHAEDGSNAVEEETLVDFAAEQEADIDEEGRPDDAPSFHAPSAPGNEVATTEEENPNLVGSFDTNQCHAEPQITADNTTPDKEAFSHSVETVHAEQYGSRQPIATEELTISEEEATQIPESLSSMSEAIHVKDSLRQSPDCSTRQQADIGQGSTILDDKHKSVNFASDVQQPVGTELHPVTVIYNDVSLALFRSSESDDESTYLLRHSIVARGALTDLFNACRGVLASDLTEEYQLELHVDRLYLTISEVRYSSPNSTQSLTIGRTLCIAKIPASHRLSKYT
jgi:hypothetical protein